MTLKDFILMGGWAMWPLMAFSVATITLIVERAISLFITDFGVRDVHDEVVKQLEAGNRQGASDLLEAAPKRKIGAAIFLSGLRVASLGEARMEKAMETEAAERIGRLESGFSLLVALGSIAPITGFLGTVSGMIGAFQSIANAADVNAQLVAGGIFEALITTAFGLAIAIVAITGYNIFAHVVDRFAAQVEVAGSDLVTKMLTTTS
jgi:biopolymer transport protein ExbB